MCDGIDNDCDGQVDDNTIGTTCAVDACRRGTVSECVNGTPTCAPSGPPPIEVCGDGIDNDCDGQVDECGQKDCAEDVGRDPISLANRSVSAGPFVDFSVSTLGKLELVRSYSSADTSYFGGTAGIFGRGWHHNWEGSVICSGDTCTVKRGGQQAFEFKFANTAPSPDGMGTWEVWKPTSDKDYHHRLIKRSTGEWSLFQSDGTERRFSGGEPSCSAAATYEGDLLPEQVGWGKFFNQGEDLPYTTVDASGASLLILPAGSAGNYVRFAPELLTAATYTVTSRISLSEISSGFVVADTLLEANDGERFLRLIAKAQPTPTGFKRFLEVAIQHPSFPDTPNAFTAVQFDLDWRGYHQYVAEVTRHGAVRVRVLDDAGVPVLDTSSISWSQLPLAPGADATVFGFTVAGVAEVSFDYFRVATCQSAAAAGPPLLSAVVDERGNVTTVAQSPSAGTLLRITDSLGHELLVQTSDGTRASALKYDGVAVVSYGYLGADLTSATDSDGHVLGSYGYDIAGSGRLNAVRNEAGDAVAEFSYNSSAEAIGTSDSESTVTIVYGQPGDPKTDAVTESYANTSTTNLRHRSPQGHVDLISGNCSCGSSRSIVWQDFRRTCVRDAVDHLTIQEFDVLGRLTRRLNFTGTSCVPPAVLPADATEERREYGLTKVTVQG